jgi:YVTN family beta-propeller protein
VLFAALDMNHGSAEMIESLHEPESEDTEVFISYAREDLRPARALRKLLVENGFKVWSDESIQVGEHWDEAIERALGSARCVIVIWSKHAVASRFVRSEASEAASQDKLVPVSIDGAELPLEFRHIQYRNVHRSFSRPGDVLSDLLAAVAEHARSEAAPTGFRIPSTKRGPWLVGAAIAVLGLGLLAAQVIGRDSAPDAPRLARVELQASPRALAGASSVVWAVDPTAGLMWRVNELDRSYVQASAPDVFEIAANGDELWATSLRGTRVRIYGDGMSQTDSVDVGGVADDIAFGFGAMWVAQRELGRVIAIDATSLSITSIPVPGLPTSLAVASSGVWVTDVGGGAVYRIDPVTNHVDDPVKVGGNPLGIAASGENVWVANTRDNTVSVIDAASNVLLSTVDVGAQPQDIAVTDDDAWVVNAGDGTLSQISRNTQSVVLTFDVGSSVNRIIAVGGAVWISDPEGQALLTFTP